MVKLGSAWSKPLCHGCILSLLKDESAFLPVTSCWFLLIGLELFIHLDLLSHMQSGNPVPLPTTHSTMPQSGSSGVGNVSQDKVFMENK